MRVYVATLQGLSGHFVTAKCLETPTLTPVTARVPEPAGGIAPEHHRYQKGGRSAGKETERKPPWEAMGSLVKRFQGGFRRVRRPVGAVGAVFLEVPRPTPMTEAFFCKPRSCSKLDGGKPQAGNVERCALKKPSL